MSNHSNNYPTLKETLRDVYEDTLDSLSGYYSSASIDNPLTLDTINDDLLNHLLGYPSGRRTAVLDSADGGYNPDDS